MKSLYTLARKLGPILSPNSITKSLYGKTEIETKILDSTIKLNLSEKLISKDLFNIDNIHCYASVITTKDMNVFITVNKNPNETVSDELKNKSIQELYKLSTVKVMVPQWNLSTNRNDEYACEKIAIVISADYTKYLKDLNDTINYISLLFKDMKMINLPRSIRLSPVTIYGVTLKNLNNYYKFMALLAIHLFANTSCSQLISNSDIYDESDFAKSLFKDATDMGTKLSKLEKIFCYNLN